MSLRLLLIILVLIIGCKFSTKKAEKQQINMPIEVAVPESVNLLVDTKPPNFNIFPHLDSLNIRDYVAIIKSDGENMSNSNVFIYQDENSKVRIATKKKALWHTWEIFDATEDHYYADIRLANFDNKGQEELIITSTSGMRMQSTMGNELYGHTEIWDLDHAQQYFELQHAYHEDDQGRNGANTYSIDCKLDLQIEPFLVTVLKDKKFSDLEVNAGCFKDEKYPKYFRLIDNEMVESINGTSTSKQ